MASQSMQPFDHNRYGPKIGGSAPFWGGELGPVELLGGLVIRGEVRREVRDKNENKLATPAKTCIRYSQQFKQV